MLALLLFPSNKFPHLNFWSQGMLFSWPSCLSPSSAIRGLFYWAICFYSLSGAYHCENQWSPENQTRARPCYFSNSNYITWGFERAAACTCYVSCSLVEPAWLCFPEVRNRKQTESGLLLIHFTWKPHLKSNELSAPRNLFQLDRSGSSKFITQLSWSLTNFWPFLFPLNSLPSIATASWSGETTILFSTTLKRQFNMRLCAHCAAQE